MKQIGFLAAAVFTISVLASCGGKKEAKTAETEPEAPAQVIHIETPVEDEYEYVRSVILDSGWTICREKEDGNMVSALNVNRGEEIYICKKGQKTEIKTADFLYQNGNKDKDVEWVKIKYKDKIYWTRTMWAAPENSFPGIIKRDTHIYSAPDDMEMTTEKLDEGTFVAWLKSSDNGFAEAVIFNRKAWGRVIYLENQAVSTATNVITQMKLKKRLDSEKLDAAVRKEMQEIADRISSDMQ